MAANIEEVITTNTTTFIQTTIGQGASLGFFGATSGTALVKKLLNDGTAKSVTDSLQAPLSITLGTDATINVFVGSGTDLSITTTSLVGTLTVTSNPLKATN